MMSRKEPICLDETEGYFRRGAERFFPVGVNYWPASCGLRMWERWDADEIREDLGLVRTLGFNSLRGFLLWQDFEPEPGEYSEEKLQRLEWFVEECTRHDLALNLSLFIGWMSGGIFWPRWKAGRNIFADPWMRARCEGFAEVVCRRVAPWAETLLAVDFGNELTCVPDSARASEEEVRQWTEAVSSVVRECLPGVAVSSGCDTGQFTTETPWKVENQRGCTLLCVHAYPVPTWNVLPTAGFTDPLAARLYEFFCAWARVYGPVLLQEFGSFLTGGDRQEAFLRESVTGAIERGANGLLWWCLHDILADDAPYAFNAFERSLGLVDASGTVKPGLAALVTQMRRWAENAEELPLAPEATVDLYLPGYCSHLGQESHRRPNAPQQLARRLLMAWHLACEAGETPTITPRDRLPEPGQRPLWICGGELHPLEIQSLWGWAKAGGWIVWDGVASLHWDEAFVEFTGVRPVDYGHARPTVFHFPNEAWRVRDWPDGILMHLEPAGAEPLAKDADGLPVILRHCLGEGGLILCLPSVADSAAHERERELHLGDRWATLVFNLLQAAATSDLQKL